LSSGRQPKEQTRDMNNRRSNIEVMADILRMGKAGKTEIMYGANMSYRQLQRYLDYLTERGFIDKTVVGNPVTQYRVNKRGFKLLENIESLLHMLNGHNNQKGNNGHLDI
jgi:predicted transcriptional regulator